MCTVLFSYGMSEQNPLVLLANRDEFYDRPTKEAHRWDDHPDIFAGRDLIGNGTWLGITDSGRIAAVTNFRDPSQPQGVRSRGALVADFLMSDDDPSRYLERVMREADSYTGFNLIAGRFSQGSHELWYFSNRHGAPVDLEPGIYGLSNHLLDTPWPKVARGKKMFEHLLSSGSPDKDDFFRLLSDRNVAEDELLPDTGVGYEIEKALSPIFIETPIYGTRCSTVVTADRDGRFEFEERVFV